MGVKPRAGPGAGQGGGGGRVVARHYLCRRTIVPPRKIDDLCRRLGTGGQYVRLRKLILTACKMCFLVVNSTSTNLFY